MGVQVARRDPIPQDQIILQREAEEGLPPASPSGEGGERRNQPSVLLMSTEATEACYQVSVVWNHTFDVTCHLIFSHPINLYHNSIIIH